jgi:hypothetical protein
MKIMITFQQIIICYTDPQVVTAMRNSYAAYIIGSDALFSDLAVVQVDPSAIL